MKEKTIKRKEYVVRIGELMMTAIEAQKKVVSDFTYGMKISDYDACEIIAKKLLQIV